MMMMMMMMMMRIIIIIIVITFISYIFLFLNERLSFNMSRLRGNQH